MHGLTKESLRLTIDNARATADGLERVRKDLAAPYMAGVADDDEEGLWELMQELSKEYGRLRSITSCLELEYHARQVNRRRKAEQNETEGRV